MVVFRWKQGKQCDCICTWL